MSDLDVRRLDDSERVGERSGHLRRPCGRDPTHSEVVAVPSGAHDAATPNSERMASTFSIEWGSRGLGQLWHGRVAVAEAACGKCLSALPVSFEN